MNPLVSLLIPVHNASPWLAATLDSALAQTHRPLEIIAVDDGSTDASPAILADYAARHPTLLRVVSQLQLGAAAARNHALRLASGDFVKFLDADDLLNPGHLALQVAALAHHPRHLAHGEWARFHTHPEAAVFTPRPGWNHSDSPVHWLAETCRDGRPMYQCGLFLIPRPLLDHAGAWDERLSLIDDFEFFTRLILASEGLRFTPGARLYYRSGHPLALSRRRDPAAWQSAFLSANLAADHLLTAEDSPRTRLAAAACLHELVFNLYPHAPHLAPPLEARARALLPSCPPPLPPGGRLFRTFSRLLGWKTALRLQHFLRR